jgi:bifunctional non-homologous end joining protein LigD
MFSRKRSPAILPRLPRTAQRPPKGAGWIHEVKHDGFRIIARRDAKGVRLFTRNGYDFTARFPKIVDAVASLSVRSCVVDGEAIVVDERGLSVFDALRFRFCDHAAVLCAFDLIELDGEDLRWVPLEDRKQTLGDLIRGIDDGIAFNQHFDGDGEIISGMPAPSGAKVSCRSAWARPIAPAASTIGSRSRIRRRRPSGAKRKRIGAASAQQQGGRSALT